METCFSRKSTGSRVLFLFLLNLHFCKPSTQKKRKKKKTAKVTDLSTLVSTHLSTFNWHTQIETTITSMHAYTPRACTQNHTDLQYCFQQVRPVLHYRQDTHCYSYRQEEGLQCHTFSVLITHPHLNTQGKSAAQALFLHWCSKTRSKK